MSANIKLSQVNETDVRQTNVESEPNAVANSSNRDQWGGQIEFILACLGNAVGLGNVT